MNEFPVLADDLQVVCYKWQYVLLGGRSFVGWKSGLWIHKKSVVSV